MNLELYTVFTTGRSEKGTRSWFFRRRFFEEQILQRRNSLHKLGSERAHAEGVRGSDGAGGSGRASEEQQASGQH
jgi:hypothetical protein